MLLYNIDLASTILHSDVTQVFAHLIISGSSPLDHGRRGDRL